MLGKRETLYTDLLKPYNYIYRVDVGASRAFDQKREYGYIINGRCKSANNPDDCNSNINSYEYYEKMMLGSRTPQVLEFSGELLEDVQIIRSTIKNTRINQPRGTFERAVENIPQLRLNNKRYKQKYLKYKNKYLQLKNKNKK